MPVAELPGRRIGHEPAMIAVRPVLRIAAVLFATVILTATGLYGLLRHEVMPDQAEVAAAAAPIPPPPRLQSDAPRDLAAQRAQEQQQLGGYGWIDAGHTLAHIPIDRAMQIYVRQHAASGAPAP